jgi:hypothetical protein
VIVGLFSPLKIPSLGALAGGNAVDTEYLQRFRRRQARAGLKSIERLINHWPLFSRQAPEKETPVPKFYT